MNPTPPNEHQSGRQPIPGLLPDLLAVALLWALVVACYWKIALAGRVLAGGDVFTYFYPYWAEATRALGAGRLALWNPYLFMGAPFLANSQAGVFYPPNWPLWLLLPAHRSVHLSIVLHLCLAALNGYLWGRASLRLGRLGSWTVGVTFALGGYLGAQVEHVNQLQGLAWLPFMLVLYDRSCVPRPGRPAPAGEVSPARGIRALLAIYAGQSPSLPALAGLALVVGLVLLAGHTQTAFISLVGLAAYALGPALWRGWRERAWGTLARRAVLLVAAAGLGVALAAVQLVPTWELSRQSVRAGGLPFNERVSFSLSPLYLARALLPGFTTPSTTLRAGPSTTLRAGPVPPEHMEHVAYVGIAGLALAAVAIGSRRSAVARLGPAVCILFLGLFLSLGLYNPLYLLLARFVPGFAHFRVPARWLALWAAGVAALAGWGADALYRRRRRVGWRGLLGLAVALVVLAGWAWAGPRAQGEVQVGWPTVAGWAVTSVAVLGLLLVGMRAPRLAAVGLLALLVLELFAASFALPHARATAPQAFTSLRPAVAHLLAADLNPSPEAGEGGGPPARFLSLSDITFDPGDLPEIQVIYGPQLSADALYDYVIAAKHKEVLSPNLPLAFGVPAVDGYDGGVLPLARYVTLQRLLLPREQVPMDGRLRENLTAVPDGRWLSLFNVRYVITDKLHDAWLDDVFYDLQLGAHLARGQAAAVAHVPHFEATALGIVSYLRDGAALPDGALVGLVEVGFGDGPMRIFELRAGEQTAEGLYGPHVAHAPATVGGHFWPGQPEGSDYVARLRWPEPTAPTKVVVRATLPEGALVVRGVSLIDERTDSFQSLVLSDRGRFRLAHSGDVKIYENLDVLPRAFVVHSTVEAADDEAALALMRAETFDPATEVVLSAFEGTALAGGASATPPPAEPGPAVGGEFARVTLYAPERVEIDVVAAAPGYLVLTDAWYPGWQATVDGERVPVLRADVLFRAVAVDAGPHRVVFTLRPASLYVGAGVSLAGVAGLVVVVLLAVLSALLSKDGHNAIMGAIVRESSEEDK